MTTSTRPAYKDLPSANARGVFGPEDRLGCLNLLTPERTAAASKLVQRGIVISLNASVTEWNNPNLFASYGPSRATPPRHEVFEFSPFARDDLLHSFNLQCSTQWDGFLHVGDAEAGAWYNGQKEESLGIDTWAETGIAGRGVILDVARWAARRGDPIDWLGYRAITATDLEEVADAQNVVISEGTILLIRTGWEEGYRAATPAERQQLPRRETTTPGLDSDPSMAARLWDWGVAAVASDNPALERWPMPESNTLHLHLLPRLGMPIGELFLLDRLAEACAAANRYEFLFTSAPLNVPGGVASPSNALALL